MGGREEGQLEQLLQQLLPRQRLWEKGTTTTTTTTNNNNNINSSSNNNNYSHTKPSNTLG